MSFLHFYAVCIFVLVNIAQAQNETQATTDLNEARALNSMFRKWGRRAPPGQWNTSGDLCSGAALDSTDLNNESYNPLIKCDCSYNNGNGSGSICHITQLKVTYMDVTGEIPDELWSLTYLTHLILNLNYLTGTISSSISNLSRLRYLFLNGNALSGNIPTEIGQLTDLRGLSLAENNFTGSLPYQMGMLSELTELYFSSSGVSGAIPIEFAQLQNLETLWASDNELTGRLPEFIGTWKKLISLRLQGNSFDGPIPPAFSNLTSITDLRISDLSNGNSSLAFIKDMKYLKVLVLRNSHISDSIPVDAAVYENLTYLDLSFNNIVGHIPESIFNSSSLSCLFLGNNKLNGTLPSQKSSSLQIIDLSYNNLSGFLPSWINESKLQINVVANYFSIEGSDNSITASGLNCLQHNFPCYRGPGLYNNFSINCGGPKIRSINGIEFENDDENITAASFYVTSTNKWAISNVGYFNQTDNPQYEVTTSKEINTSDPQLFQTSRVSASSLRYYGLALKNGHYNVSLMFAETAFPISKRWESTGRRVFNIYIQGDLKIKDFDIRKVAGGQSFQAVQMEFEIQVRENYLEIHLFWAGKGTCCIPYRWTYGPAISAISASLIDSNAVGKTNNKSSTPLIVGIVLGGLATLLFLLVVIRRIQRRKSLTHVNEGTEFTGMDARPYIFSYDSLKTATEDFSPANKLGEGGFGPVYKGTLADGRVVAVKQLSLTSHQGKKQFAAEIATISAVQHRNLVRLYGCCIEGDKRLIVYEFMEKKSLDQALFAGKKDLDLNWSARFYICLGVARGLAYLHEESQLRIVHRDVKASNILLDSFLRPKISDFGLAKLYDHEKSHISTGVAGTIGYLAPEYVMLGHLTEKVDVFAFGVVALEVVSGKQNARSRQDEDDMYLLEWAWQLYESNREVELVDSRLSEFNEEEVKRMIRVAFECTQTSPMSRPPMSRVVAMLVGDVEVRGTICRPGYLNAWKLNDEIRSLDSENSRKCPSASTHMVAESYHLACHPDRSVVEEILEEAR